MKWFGHVLVSQTIHVMNNTSLNITGASTDATVDGKHVTQLVSADSASSLHLASMALANGDAEFGGAVHVTDQASVSFGGNMTFEANNAWYGGAVYAGPSSTVFWDGKETMFIDNSASHNGGAIMGEDSSFFRGVASRCSSATLPDREGALCFSANHRKCRGAAKRHSVRIPLHQAVQCTRSPRL